MDLEVTVWSAHSSRVGFNRMSGDDSVDIQSFTVSCFALLAVFVEESVVASILHRILSYLSDVIK